jgi:hypothetical protein
MTDRPYPDGIAWDEAWRQRQRADALERLAMEIIHTATDVDDKPIECLNRDYDGARLKRRILGLKHFLKEGTE